MAILVLTRPALPGGEDIGWGGVEETSIYQEHEDTSRSGIETGYLVGGVSQRTDSMR
jgi:hypothetical protein